GSELADSVLLHNDGGVVSSRFLCRSKDPSLASSPTRQLPNSPAPQLANSPSAQLVNPPATAADVILQNSSRHDVIGRFSEEPQTPSCDSLALGTAKSPTYSARLQPQPHRSPSYLRPHFHTHSPTHQLLPPSNPPDSPIPQQCHPYLPFSIESMYKNEAIPQPKRALYLRSPPASKQA
ncbi:9032_t:CDS:2, partial [Paraglomus occultum]